MSLSRSAPAQSDEPARDPTASLLTGFASPFRAIGLIRREPRLLRWVWAPALVNVCALTLAGWLAWSWLHDTPPGAAGELLGPPLYLLATAARLLLLLLGVLVLYALLALPLAAPFSASLGEQVQLASQGVIDARSPTPELFGRGLRRVAGQLRRLLPLLLLQLLLVAVGWLPVVGGVAAAVLRLAVGLPLTLLLVGWLLVEAALGETGGLERRRLRLLLLYRTELSGLGAAVLVLLVLPGLNLVALPAALAGGALVGLGWRARGAHHPVG